MATPAPGTFPFFPQYQPGALQLSGNEITLICSSATATAAATYYMTLADFVGKAPSIMPVGNPSITDIISVFRPSSGLYFSSAVGNLGLAVGNIPVFGTQSQVLTKNSAVNYDASWYSLATLITAGPGLAVASTATGSLMITATGIATGSLPTPYQTSIFNQAGVIYGNGTGVLQATLAGNAGQVLTGQGAAGPIFSLLDLTPGVSVTGVLAGANYSAVNLAASGAGGVQGVLATGNMTAINLATTAQGGVQGVLPVANGGQGTSTLTTNGILFGNAGAKVGITAAAAAGSLLIANGTLTAPSFTTASLLLDAVMSTTQGSIAYRSSASWVALVPGTPSQLLQTLGSTGNPKWVSAGPVLLNTLTPSNVSSTNDTSSMTPTYSRYRVSFDNVVCASSTAPILEMQVATTASAFITGGYVSVAQTNVNSVVSTDTSTTVILLSGLRATTWIGTATAYGLFGYVEIENPSGGINRKNVLGNVSYLTAGASGTTTFALGSVSGYFDSTTAISGLNFLFNSGNIQTGVIKIYGIP